MKRNWLGISLLVAAVSSVGLMATEAMALPSQGIRIVYYSDANYSDIVGRSVLACTGHYTVTGVQSDYYMEEDEDCDTSGDGAPPPCTMGETSDICHYYIYPEI